MTSKKYPTDLSNAEWHRLARLVPGPKPGGRPLKYARREIINAILYNAILYLVRAGCPWRLLPNDLPPWQLVYYYFRLWTRAGWWQHWHDHLRAQVRQRAGRRPQASAAIMDAQTIKTTEQPGLRGYDAAKKVTGRKRHILVDTLGLVLVLVIHSAALQDRTGAQLVLGRLAVQWHRLRLIWADGAYAGQLQTWVASLRSRAVVRLEIVRRSDAAVGFEVLPKRWIVERTFGWLNRCRRLSKDYEGQVPQSEAIVYIALRHLMLRRLHNEGTF